MLENILVAGGAGYIGSHTVRFLKKAGFSSIIYDNLSSGHKEAVRDFHLVVGDLSNKKLLDNAFKKYKPTAVIHFAGYIEAGESVTDPQRFFHNNLINGINLLDTMVENEVDKIVFSSSAAVYGEPKKIPVKEEDEKKPTNPYGLTKLMFEQVLESYDRAYDIKSVSLRYFNAAGADPSSEIGADHKNKTHLMTLAILTALGKRSSIKIFGDDYPTPDGTCVRDYIHVSDLADAHVLALKYLEEKNISDCFNLGNEKGNSVKEVVEMTKKVTGKDFKVEIVERRAGDPAKVVASSKKAKDILGWEPKSSSLEDIIRTAWNWHEKHSEGYKEYLKEVNR
jgi:UDP-glucose 4-epimerase